MDKKIAGLLGAVAGVATLGAAHATPAPANPMAASSYADLLAPVPNAVEALKTDNEARTQAPEGVQLAQYHHHHHHHYRRHHHHHHHYRHHHSRWWYRHHHHHHHHHHGAFIGIPGVGGVVVRDH